MKYSYSYIIKVKLDNTTKHFTIYRTMYTHKLKKKNCQKYYRIKIDDTNNYEYEFKALIRKLRNIYIIDLYKQWIIS